jgi:formamidopyrimidine-DNA glycosylase
MPELPEVETTARVLRHRLPGLRVRDVQGVDWPRMLPNATAEEMAEALRGHAVTAVDRRGKYLLVRFEGDLSLAIHRKMSGNLLLVPRAAPTEPHTHFVLRLDQDLDLRLVDARKFGRVHLFRSPAELEAFINLDLRLGLEPLGDALDARALLRQLARRRVPIKTALLDQTVLAGMGNLYADEALWDARIHPLQPANTLSLPALRRLLGSVRTVLELGIDRRGTSFSTYVDADGLAGDNQAFLRAYGRAGEPCPRCGTPLSRIRLGQRSAHYCRRCQRLRVKPPSGASRSGSPTGTARPRPAGSSPAATSRAPAAAGPRR